MSDFKSMFDELPGVQAKAEEPKKPGMFRRLVDFSVSLTMEIQGTKEEIDEAIFLAKEIDFSDTITDTLWEECEGNNNYRFTINPRNTESRLIDNNTENEEVNL